MVGESIQQCGGHLVVDEHLAPLREVQVCGDHDARMLVELGEQVKQQGAASLAEG